MEAPSPLAQNQTKLRFHNPEKFVYTVWAMMIRSSFGILSICALLFTSSPIPLWAFTFDPNYVISDSEMTDSDSMSQSEIQAFLDAYGTLGSREFTDIDDEEKSTAAIIHEAANRNGINPRMILIMLQKEQSLINDTSPTQNQLDWAMGYGICDNCNYNTSSAQRFRGFAKQINSATLQFTEGYLVDIETSGETVMGFGPGITVTIDDEMVTPSNSATAALYTYTPHLHGNSNFAKLWYTWFTHEYPNGTLMQNTEDGGVWLIQDGLRRPITSRTALLTRFNERFLVPVTPTTLESYIVGASISLPNYSLLRSPRGTVYLLIDDTLRGISSQEAFRAIGFNPDDIIDVTQEELDAYEEGEPITADTQYPQTVLLQDAKTGGVYAVQNGMKAPLLSKELMTIRYPGTSLTPTEPELLEKYETIDPVLFSDGTLVGVAGDPAVYVVSDGKRLPILDEDTFLGLGWKWEQVVWTNKKSVELHPLGEALSIEEEAEEALEESEDDISTTSVHL